MGAGLSLGIVWKRPAPNPRTPGHGDIWWIVADYLADVPADTSQLQGRKWYFQMEILTLRYRCPSRYCSQIVKQKHHLKSKPLHGNHSHKQEASQLMKTCARFCFVFLLNIYLKNYKNTKYVHLVFKFYLGMELTLLVCCINIHLFFNKVVIIFHLFDYYFPTYMKSQTVILDLFIWRDTTNTFLDYIEARVLSPRGKCIELCICSAFFM